MGISEEDLSAFPHGEELVETVRDAIGLGEKTRQRQAQETLASLFYKPLMRLIKKRYQAYYHIGGFYEREDDLQRLYMYIMFGHREDSKGGLNPTNPPLLTWLKNLEKEGATRDLMRYVISIANRYLKFDLPRNINRGRGHETLVRWNEEESTDRGDMASAERMERGLQLNAHEMVQKEKIHHDETLALRRCVWECLDSMPSEEAELLLAKHCQIPYENFTQVEYARKMGISESTVSRRLTRGEETLVSLLRSRCPDLLERLGWSKQA